MITLSDFTSRLSAYDPDALSVMQAQEIIRNTISPIDVAEDIALHAALGRVLACDIISPIDVPQHDNSAMDGYALRAADLQEGMPLTLRIVGTAHAGNAYRGMVGAGECVHIMTGAVMPEACDSVIARESTLHATAASVVIPADAVRQGENRRLRGEDLRAGTPALSNGKILRPADMGLIASLGIGTISVQRRLRVAFFSTGNELRAIGESLDEGTVYDSNRYTLLGMLARLGCELIDMGIVNDNPAALEAAFRRACENADAVITSGGVSDGAADYTRKMMAQLGDVVFWKIGMRPGRPMAFGKISSDGHSAYLFGLPGNPVAVMVSFYFFARQALLHMMGAQAELPHLVPAISQADIRKKPGRSEYQRGIVSRDDKGQLLVRITGSQGSGILRSMSEANCMVVLPDDRANVSAGETVDVMLFDGLI